MVLTTPDAALIRACRSAVEALGLVQQVSSLEAAEKALGACEDQVWAAWRSAETAGLRQQARDVVRAHARCVFQLTQRRRHVRARHGGWH